MAKLQRTSSHTIYHNGKALGVEIEWYATFTKAYIIDKSKYFCVVESLRFPKKADAVRVALEVRDYCIATKLF